MATSLMMSQFSTSSSYEWTTSSYAQSVARAMPAKTNAVPLSSPFLCKKEFSQLQLSPQLYRARASISRSTTAELAADADKGHVIDVESAEAMEQLIGEAGDKLVVVDVSTRTCGPCKLIYPKVVRLSIDYPEAVFLKINGDLNSSTRTLMRKWGVKAVPHFRFFRKGQLVHSHSGAKENELRAHFLIHYQSVTADVPA